MSELLRPFGGALVLACNFDVCFLPSEFPRYYRTLLSDWFSIPRAARPVSSAVDIAQVIIWNNRDLLIGAKPFFFSDWAHAGIFYIGHWAVKI